jgi:hypothetical protein
VTRSSFEECASQLAVTQALDEEAMPASKTTVTCKDTDSKEWTLVYHIVDGDIVFALAQLALGPCQLAAHDRSACSIANLGVKLAALAVARIVPRMCRVPWPDSTTPREQLCVSTSEAIEVLATLGRRKPADRIALITSFSRDAALTVGSSTSTRAWSSALTRQPHPRQFVQQLVGDLNALSAGTDAVAKQIRIDLLRCLLLGPGKAKALTQSYVELEAGSQRAVQQRRCSAGLEVLTALFGGEDGSVAGTATSVVTTLAPPAHTEAAALSALSAETRVSLVNPSVLTGLVDMLFGHQPLLQALLQDEAIATLVAAHRVGPLRAAGGRFERARRQATLLLKVVAGISDAKLNGTIKEILAPLALALVRAPPYSIASPSRRAAPPSSHASPSWCIWLCSRGALRRAVWRMCLAALLLALPTDGAPRPADA